MENIKDIIKTVIGNIADQNPDVHNKAERVWKNLVNEKEQQHTKVIGVKDGTLHVCVDSPAWLYQIRIRQTKMLRQLKEDVPEVKRIRLKMGKIT